jgi:small GTP-binding protein
MPANLPPQYIGAEKRYRQARSPQDKIACLEEMLAIIPKHKGTEKLQGDLKKRLSKLRGELQKKKAISRKSGPEHVEREGIGQVVLVGLPNVGKSMLLSQMTKANPFVADYPFTTRTPLPGMMEYENVQIQLIDLPPISREYMESWLPVIIRQADLALLVIDLNAEDLLEQIDTVKEVLAENRIALETDEMNKGENYKKTLIVANKFDLPESQDNLSVLQELSGQEHLIFPVSAEEGTNLEGLKAHIYHALDVVRVYTKAPGKEANYNEPLAMKKGSNVLDVAQSIHKDFSERLKFARIWGKDKYAGQKVHRDHIIQEGDIIEFHI